LELRESKLTEEKRNMRNGIFIICNLQQALLHFQIKEDEKAGNMARIIAMKNVYKILVGKPEALGLL
jgi:hypothetical protein